VHTETSQLICFLAISVHMPQPKFLTKAERAALALQRRQEETAGLRAQQEELRHGLQRQQVQQVGGGGRAYV
jgi:hypothetical protein